MWLFEKHGFISVVAYDPAKDKKSDSPFRDIVGWDKTNPDPKCADTHLLVRARIKEDLDMLKRVEPNLVIDTDKSADYSFRCVVRRTRLKKFLAQAVDGITYDSHFKEVADKFSPQVQGRHTAMMSCWTAMSKLQPYSPYGGGFGGSDWYDSYGYSGGKYGSTWSGGGKKTGTSGSGSSTAPKKSGGSGKASSGNGASAGIVAGSTAQYGTEGTAADKRGYETVTDWIDAYYDSEGNLDWRAGTGPRHGFQIGDKVEGYFGTGKVTKVEVRKDIDVIHVDQDKGPNASTFLSTYLIPAGIPPLTSRLDSDLEDEGEEKDLDEFGLPADRSIDGTYTWLLDHGRKPSQFPPDDLPKLDDHAFELITRAAERVGEADEQISVEDLNDVYDEIVWENADDDQKVELVMRNCVPRKHMDEALKLPAFSSSKNN